MKNSKVLLTLAAFGLLVGGLVGCGNKNSEPADSSEAPVSQSSQDESKSSSEKSSSKESSSSSTPEPVHEHSYAKVGDSVKNEDGKEVFLMECEKKDDRYITIAFDDYSEKSADFDAAATASKYGEVDATIIAESHMIVAGETVSWKINVDKAISGASLVFGVTTTYASHGDQECGSKYSVQVNDGEFVTWAATGTYDDNGFAPTKRTYLTFQTIDLVEGQNVITLKQGSGGYRLLFGGEVRIHYNSDAKPVAAPFKGYDVTFTVEHCKVYVYNTKAYDTETPVETLTCKAKDEEGNIVAYDPEDIELQPQVSFKVVCDEGYSVTVNNVTATPKENYKNLKQNPDSVEGQDNIFRITKVKGDLAISIIAQAGEQAKGYKVTFVPTHCTIKVYIGPRNEAGDNLDTAEDGVYYARVKDFPYDIGYTTPQINFEVVCDDGYEFVPVITDSKVDFITHADATKDGYNKFSDKGGYYNLTKVDDDLTITITATAIAA